MSNYSEYNQNPGQVITFYSYKGGVGRSMALANVACILADEQSKINGRGVLVVDCDLEAPGLHRYFSGYMSKHFKELKLTEQRIDDQPGMLELFSTLDKSTQKYKAPQTEDLAQEIIKSINFNNYIINTDLPKLSLIKAGRLDEKYAKRVNKFSWEKLFNRSPYLYRSLAEYWADQYQYVLIDSRTGETDISGVCTILMPEKLVLVFSANSQSTRGVLRIAEKAIKHRYLSDDLRPLQIYPLPSRIDESEMLLSNNWRMDSEYGYQFIFEKLLIEYNALRYNLNDYFNEVQIQYSPYYSYGENIAVLDAFSDTRLSLATSYRTFSNKLIADNLFSYEKFDAVFNTHVDPNIDQLYVQLPLIIHENESVQSVNVNEIFRLNEEQYPVMVILGPPGSGKSTLLQRLELDYYRQYSKAKELRLPFYVKLHQYSQVSLDDPIEPLDFLQLMWAERYKDTGLELKSLLREGRVLLLLDAINEIPHSISDSYNLSIDLWRKFSINQQQLGNKIIFTSRSFDDSQSLRSPELQVLNIALQPLTEENIIEFLKIYLPEEYQEVFEVIKDDEILEFYNNPYYLSLLCKQIAFIKSLPESKLSLNVNKVREITQQLENKEKFNQQNIDNRLNRIISNVNAAKSGELGIGNFDELTRKYLQVFAQLVRNDSHQLDEKFVQLTLMIDKGEEETQRWERRSLESIGEIIKMNEEDYPVMVILGAPGSGKSTILRRLELDYYRGQIGAEGNRLSFFVPLNRYKPGAIEKPVEPIDFLESMWGKYYDDTGITLRSLLKEGRLLLLLDAVNEIQHSSSEDYEKLIDLWREFSIDHRQQGNRIIFTCRSLDYSHSLSSPDMRVPNVELQPLTVEKIREFLQVYQPANHAKVFEEIRKAGTLEFYNNPYFLSLLCNQIGKDGEVPKGHASLFTGYVRAAMKREMDSDLFTNEGFLSKSDRLKLTRNQWANVFHLPEASKIPERLSHLAYEMQQSGEKKENKQIRIGFKQALELIGIGKPEKIIECGVAISVLDQDIHSDEVKFHHQLLHVYFAARRLAEEPKPELVSVEWRASEVRPTLAETLVSLANGDPLPPPGQTGWEETTLAALPMSNDPEGYVAKLIEHNLPLAARCAVSPEVKISEELKNRIRRELIGRTQDKKADLRARIAAGDALGLIGDPRFEKYQSEEGECLLPPMVEIPGGEYLIGDDYSGFTRERPAHKVRLNAYKIGVYPVTNAEYAKFIEAGGYEEECWWDTANALRWLRKGGAEDQKKSFRDDRLRWQNNWTDDEIRGLIAQKRATEQQVESFLWRRNSTEEEFERQLDEWFPRGILDRVPRYWDDSTYNSPAQPVVGICWYEARAYCKWLSEVTGDEYRLPTEVEYEAATRGLEGRKYAYGEDFDSERCNTLESHIRRPTPVGIFDNRTPEGAYDLTGNVWTWTTTIYDKEKYGYPYKAEDGREDTEVRAGSEEGSTDGKSVRAADRVFRGGGWSYSAVYCRSARRIAGTPGYRGDDLGFRLSRTLPLALLPLRAE